MIKTGLWIELEATVGFILGLGLASLMGQRLIPVILIIVFQLILTPVLGFVPSPICRTCSDHSSGSPWRAWSLPGSRCFSGCRVLPEARRSRTALLPESAIQAAWVIIAWLTGCTILGAWRMMTRDA